MTAMLITINLSHSFSITTNLDATIFVQKDH